MRARPLSPHLSVYRFAHNMALSITHRISGLYLSSGLLVLVWWVTAAASTESAYADATRMLSHWFARLLLLGWLLAFCYHFANGIRHLLWDAGLGLEKHQARRSSTVVVIITVVTFAVLVWRLFAAQAGTP
jgi:succinate dehydrogenase / fumarate reductase cytochrome b subunit